MKLFQSTYDRHQFHDPVGDGEAFPDRIAKDLIDLSGIRTDAVDISHAISVYERLQDAAWGTQEFCRAAGRVARMLKKNLRKGATHLSIIG